MSPDVCSVSIRRTGDVAIVEVGGEIDIATVSLLAKALQDAARTGRKRVVLDARELTYIDSTGIQTLISFQRRFEEQEKGFAIVGCHGIFRKLITVARLDRRLPMFTSLDEALA